MDKNGTNSGSPASPIWLICAMSTVAARAQRGVHSQRYGDALPWSNPVRHLRIVAWLIFRVNAYAAGIIHALGPAEG
jgi:hypothetical protein